MYAIIETGGKQYKVSEGDIIRVEKLGAEIGETVEFPVLAVSEDGAVKVAEEAAAVKVSATVMCNGKDKKVIVYKYKSKKGYHKKNGHRQLYTQVKINTIA